MSDILEQIQDLNNKFSTLFEVEGLGDPSQEVPPSTNKLKKDVKTKNGKVELVSVENELFPYEGNKKEQFQQKVLDTINGMIQGTKTLEDLLQVVRQKKAPLKEAMEILEEIINEKNANVRKKHKAETDKAEKERGIDREANPLAAYVDDIKRYNQHTIHGLSKYKTGNEDKDWPINNAISSLAKETKDTLGRKYYPENPYHKPFVLGGKYHDLRGNLEQKEYEVKGRGKYHPSNNDHRKEVIGTNIERERKIHPHLPKDKSSEALKEAMEILEELINEVSDKTAQAALDKAKERYYRKGYEASMKLFQGDSKGSIEDGNKAQDEYNKHINMQQRRAKREGKKLVQDKNDHDSFRISNEALREAMEILEGLFVNDGRGDFFDDLSKLLTGKTLKQHISKGTAQAIKKLSSKILPKNTEEKEKTKTKVKA